MKTNRSVGPRVRTQSNNQQHRGSLKIIDAIHDSWVRQDAILAREDGDCSDRPLSSTEYSPSTSHQKFVDRLNTTNTSHEVNDESASLSLHDKIIAAGVCIRDRIQPQGDCPNDDSVGQRVLNVVTSLPFFAVGMIMKRRLSSPEGKAYGNSMLLVGAAATMYHATSGRLRTLARKFDYYAIAHASGKMTRALWPHSKTVKYIENASWFATPFKPFFVSTAYALAMQTEFLRLGTKDDSLKPHLFGHGITAAAGIFAFSMEEALDEHAGFKHMHSLWHCLSAYGVYTVGKLIEYKEASRFGAHQHIHDSALSLVDLDKVSKL